MWQKIEFIEVVNVNSTAADLLANGSRSRPVGDRPVTGAGYLASANGLDVFQGQQSAVVARGTTPVPGAAIQRAPSSPLAPDVSLRGNRRVMHRNSAVSQKATVALVVTSPVANRLSKLSTATTRLRRKFVINLCTKGMHAP